MSNKVPEVNPWKVLLYTCAAVFIVTLDAAILCVGSESAHAASAFTALYSGLTTAALVTALLGAFVRTAPTRERVHSLAVSSELS